MSNDSERRVAPRHHHETRHLEPARELAILHHERALPRRRREVRLQTPPRRLQQLGAARRLRAQFREPRQRRTLERPFRYVGRCGHPREDLPKVRVLQQRMGEVRVGIVVNPEDRRAGRQDVEKTRLLSGRYADGRQLRRGDFLHGGLERGIELAQRLKVLAEILRAYGTRRIRRPGVQHAAANGVLSHRRHLARALVASRDQTRLYL